MISDHIYEWVYIYVLIVVLDEGRRVPLPVLGMAPSALLLLTELGGNSWYLFANLGTMT